MCRCDSPAVLFYNAWMKSWDVIIAGGGIIGLSLSIALRKSGARVVIVERGEPGQEASSAAGGMLVDCSLETHTALQSLATLSARLYPEFVHEIEMESGMKVDLRDQGAIIFPPPEQVHEHAGLSTAALLHAPLAELEPALARDSRVAFLLEERSVDPQALAASTVKTAKHRGVDFSSGDPAISENLTNGRHTCVENTKTTIPDS